ncbi:hypothetical protein [Staphylococcus capitis]|uniref:hypothetical protein n=1 Tax=Staphylococcus capitis TaxID=29388 RepID=UPI002DB56394|nr:hypothetical protein [Staphylococcus capitis]MEB5628442.1 hypothetical protein [Staphylococcus capitis]
MPKIKVEKQMTLPELIKYAWKNDIRNKKYHSNTDEFVTVNFDVLGHVRFSESIAQLEKFTVETEEEITRDTILSSIVVVRTQHFLNNEKIVNVAKINDASINKIINIQPNHSSYEVHEIYLMNEIGIGKLLWKDGVMVD